MKRLVCLVSITLLFVTFFQLHTFAYTKKTAPLMTTWGESLTPDQVLPEYPRPQLTRQRWLNLNGIWQFQEGGPSDTLPTGSLSEDILVPFPIESALSGIMRQHERVWYKRTFNVPTDWNGDKILLHFGAIDWESEVFINGVSLGVHRGGYDAFSYDITPHLTSSGLQELTVRVYDPTDDGYQPRGKQVKSPEGIYYTPVTGIWQTVWLEPVSPDTYIEKVDTTTDIDTGTVSFNLTASQHEGVTAIIAVLEENEVVASTTSDVSDIITLALENPRLWSPEDPYLYDVQVTLKRGDAILDEITSYLGMRKIERHVVDGYNKIILNNSFYFQKGLLDQGYWPDGLYTAPSDDALKYDIIKAKEMGFNMLRKHVKIEPARWYYWADRLGILVWQDMPSANNSGSAGRNNYEIELKAMIDGLKPFPSVIMWVVFNEGWGQFDTPRLTNWTKTYDPTRLVSNASGWTDKNVGDILDHHHYPSPVAPVDSNRAVVCGEYGGVKYAIDNHMWKSGWGYTTVNSGEELMDYFEGYMETIKGFKNTKGLSGVVYTELTDVEIELNGFITYDRKVIKVDVNRMKNINDFSLTKTPLLLTSENNSGQSWKYTTQAPPPAWTSKDFDDTSWQTGIGGFGTVGTPGTSVHTNWETNHIWLRKDFFLPSLSDDEVDKLLLRIHHDEDAKVYINGVLASHLTGYTTNYIYRGLSEESKATLLPGRINTIAIYCEQTTGGQYIDAGLYLAGDYTFSFNDDFSTSDMSLWNIIDGLWQVNDGKMNVQQYTGAKIINPFVSGADFTYTADLQVDNDASYSDVGLLFRVTEANTGLDQIKGYYVGLNGAHDKIILGKFDHNWTELASQAFTLTSDKSYPLKISAIGNNIKVYVGDSDTPIIDHSDDSYSSGQIGLRVFQSAAQFDNISFVRQ